MAVCDDQHEGSKPKREHAYELTNERDSWGSVLPSAFQYLSSLLSLHSPEHVSDMERVNRCKINNSTVVKIGKKIAGEDSMRRFQCGRAKNAVNKVKRE